MLTSGQAPTGEPTCATTVSETVELSDGTEIRLGTHVSTSAPTAPRPRSSWALFTLATLAVLTALYVARDVIVPLVFALLLALLLRPLLRRMKTWHLPNAFSALLLIGAVVTVYVLVIWSLAGQAQRWLADAPETLRTVKAMLPKGPGPMQDLRDTGKAMGELAEPESESGDPHPASPEPPPNGEADAMTNDVASAFVGTTSHFVGASIIVFVVAYFLLVLADQLIRQAVALMPSFDEKRSVVELVANVEQGISRYLATIAVINVGLGIVTGLAMWAMGLPNPILWGVMATALNSVPHVGAFICMVVLFFVGTISHQSLGHGLAAAGVFALITSVESYFITPLVLSKRLELSPLAVILSILFWGWLWGAGGALLAAPLLAITKIICDQFPSLHPLAAILGGESPS